jgi:predicted nuclease of predicted toxin-antitoxin system
LRFLADMGVSLAVVRWLRSEGHDATHLREESLERLGDPDIFNKAIAEDRVILTFDLDFGEIAALSKGTSAKVIVFRLRNTRAANVIAGLLLCSRTLRLNSISARWLALRRADTEFGVYRSGEDRQ